jgi:predicted alpha/beta-fold hydrolase
VNGFDYQRERLDLPDGDFVDLDWIRQGHSRLMVLCHGLEGGSDSQYMKGMARTGQNNDWDILALNFRSCSGEINRAVRMYHHGEIEDLEVVLQRKATRYPVVALVGFSLGGNVIVKYAARKGSLEGRIKTLVAISTPCDLASSSRALDRWQNKLYSRRFRRSLLKKFRKKVEQYPGMLDLSNYHKVKSWREFDDTFTTRLTGFRDADEYYQQGSANNFIREVEVPTLILNALNDPFLEDPSYPLEVSQKKENIILEMPEFGGHVGFWYPGRKTTYAEDRCIEFLHKVVGHG